MDTYVISPECVALILDRGVKFSFRLLVMFCLMAKGYKPWKSMEAEIFQLEDRTLLLARPSNS